MKRFFSIIVILALLCSLSVNCFAEESNDVFYTQPDEELAKTIEDLESRMAENDKIYVERFILKEGEQYEPEKMVYDKSQLYKFKWWTLEEFEALITSDDIKTEIRNFKPLKYIFPCYYNGELLENYREMIGWQESIEDDGTGSYVVDSSGENFSPSGADINYTTKEEVEEYMENAGIVGYNIVYALHATGLRCAIVEKDNEIFIVPLLKNDLLVNKAVTELCKREKELIDKQVLSVEETCYIIDEYRKIAAELKNDLDEGVQNTTNNNLQSVTDENTDFPWNFVLIGGGAALILAGAIAVFVLKKKKA